MKAWLERRSVVILIGDADTGSASLDVTCGATLQGPNRYQRGLNLMRFIDTYHDGHGHARRVVPGVGHSSRDMYTSLAGLDALFVP